MQVVGENAAYAAGSGSTVFILDLYLFLLIYCHKSVLKNMKHIIDKCTITISSASF